MTKIDVKSRTKGEVRLLRKYIAEEMEDFHRVAVGKNTTITWNAEMFGEQPADVKDVVDGYVALARLLAECDAVLGKKVGVLKIDGKPKSRVNDDSM